MFSYIFYFSLRLTGPFERIKEKGKSEALGIFLWKETDEVSIKEIQICNALV